jgi:ubiquinone/menaquinone biosynthesis C-methylase UbiE
LSQNSFVTFKDHFSKRADDYAKYRPRYPRELFEYLGSIAPSLHLAWDCGTGNGQAAVGLASVFDRVIATDASEKQIANAQPHERVEYRVATAEDSGLESAAVDLVTVTQALHWFELDRFYAEAKRVLTPNGVLAASAYLFAQIEPAIDAVLSRYYHDVVGPFWARERKLVENFTEIPFPFHEIDSPKFEMTAQWDLHALVGYLRTWSASQKFLDTTGTDPVEHVIDNLRAAWRDPDQTRKIIWPLVLRIGVKNDR